MKLGPKQQEWVDALRDGTRKQCTGALKSLDNKYCCLGVLCELHQLKTKMLYYEEDETEQRPDGIIFCYGHNEDHEVLPKGFDKEIGLYSKSGEIKYTVESTEYCDELDLPVYASLAESNDGGWTFQEIADFIERFPELVFEREV